MSVNPRLKECTGHGRLGLTCGFNSDDGDAIDNHVLAYHLNDIEPVYDCDGDQA